MKKAGKSISTKGAERLIERVGTDMEMLSNELEKCIGYVGESKLIDVPEVDAICSGVTVSKMFDMIDAVALGERAEEYAPPVTFQTIVDWMHGKSYHTKSFEMSMKKSKFIYRWIYKSYCYYCDNIRGKIFKNKY